VRATVVVVGHGATWVEKALTERARADVNLVFVEQSEQLGTATRSRSRCRRSTTNWHERR